MNIGEYRATFTAQTEGQQAINALSNSVKDLSAQVKQFAAEAGVGGNAAAQMAAKAQAAGNAVTASAGQQRAGMQQLSYQLGDVATMYSMGANASQIFASQLGQTVQAVQMMTGGTSRLAAFLGGPWGMAISVGAIALAPLIGKLFETGKAADDAAAKVYGLKDALADIKTKPMEALGTLNAQVLAAEGRLRAARALPGYTGGGSEAFKRNTFAERQKAQAIADAELDVQAARSNLSAAQFVAKSIETMAGATDKASGTARTHAAAVHGSSSAMSVAQKQAEALAKSEEALANAALRSAYAFDQKIRALDGNNSLATGIIGAEPIKPQTVTERLAADNASELAKMGEALKGSPAKQAIESYGETISNVGKSAFDTWTKGLKGTEDALVNFAMTGKLSFKDLANSIIADLVRIAIQQTIMKSLTKLFGFADGGVFSGGSVVANAAGNAFSGGNVVPFASGGVVGRPMTFPMSGGRTGLMGEAGPEAIMPLRRMGNGRLGVEASGGAPNVVVNVDASGSQVQGNNERANALGQAIAVAVRSELIQQKRPGGLLAAA